jgi:2,4-dienoyl-CoA reductase-like NADH-dependent reductase (Old Yellow Enzyme family)
LANRAELKELLLTNLLFTPARLGSLTIKNRLVRSAMAEGLADPDGAVTEHLVALYRRLAEGGVGLVITGHCSVHPLGKATRRMTSLEQDNLIPSHRRLTREVHDAGGTVAVQLNHGGRVASLGPDDMTEGQIEEATQAFADASRRAVEAGYDAIQLHAAHGWLISQFLSPCANHRTDKWGGTPENRRRFLMEVYRRVGGAAGDGVPLCVKLNAEDHMLGGLTPDESAETAKALEAEGIDAIEVSAGFVESRHLITRSGIDAPEKEAYNLPGARVIRRAVRVPLMLVGGLRSREIMERVLSEEGMDCVSLCRPFVRQPDLASKLKSGEIDRVS